MTAERGPKPGAERRTPRRPRTAFGPVNVRSVFAATMSEAELDQCVRDLAKLLKLHVFSIRNSKTGQVTARGWPDLAIAGPGGLTFAELKREDGKLRPEQALWGAALTQAGARWTIWRPSDWISGDIERELRQLATQTSPR